MTILSEVLRTHVRCDVCTSAYIHAEGDVAAFLIDHGWRVDGGRHCCPRCARRAKW
jgi:hypothetical protein